MNNVIRHLPNSSEKNASNKSIANDNVTIVHRGE